MNFLRVIVALLVVCVARIAPCEAAEPVVFLKRTDQHWITWQGYSNKSALRRELARQALLIAAREEFGLRTRDELLGESVPDGTPHKTFSLQVVAGSRTEPNRILLIQHTEEGAQQIDEWGVRGRNYYHYQNDVNALQKLSREAMVESLKKLGFTPRTIERNEQATVPEDCQKLLADMNFVSQFQAVRRLHAEMEHHGDADPLLVALARAYANLGMLTEHHWSPMHQAFKARALLYAQRLVANNRENPEGHAVCGYTLALAGVHQGALRHFRAARRALKDAPLPTWAALAEAHTHYDLEKLTAEPDDEHRELALLLHYITCEQGGSSGQMINSAQVTFDEMPDAYRIYEAVSHQTGVGLNHRLTMIGLLHFGQALYPSLAALPDLPPEVAKIVKQQQQQQQQQNVDEEGWFGADGPDAEFLARQQLMRALKKSGETVAQGKEDSPATPEFYYPILGQMIADSSITQVGRRVWFMARQWGVEPEDFIDAAAPLVDDHRYRPLLECACFDIERKLRGIEEAKKISFIDVEVPAGRFFYWLPRTDKELRDEVFLAVIANGDMHAEAIVKLLTFVTEKWHGSYGRNLLGASPHSPYAKALLLYYEWDKYKNRAKGWEQQAPQHVRLARTLGRMYRLAERFDEAEKWYRQAIELAPAEYHAYEGLSALYAQQENYKQWQATLEEFLEQPDYGLHHTKIYSMITWFNIRQRQWDKALPFGQKSAESYAGRGLLAEAMCHEGLGNWDAAEALYRAIAQRYNQPDYWLGLCIQTGRGDLQAAREFSQQYIDQQLRDPQNKRSDSIARLYLLLDKPKKALEILERSFEHRPDPLIGLWAALVADRLGNAERRDALLKAVQTRGTEFKPPQDTTRAGCFELAALFTKDLEQGGKAEFDLKQLEEACVKESILNDLNRFACVYLAGEYLMIHGKPQEARALLARCAEPTNSSFFRAFAGQRLVAQGIKPSEFSSFVNKENDKVWLYR